MQKDTNFLCEIGTEEIPAGYLPPAIDAVKKILKEKFKESRIDFSSLDVFSTPRRISIFVSNLATKQKEEIIELKGPSEKVAFDSSGNPTKALQGFLKGNSIDLNDIYKDDKGKGNYIFAKKELGSMDTIEIIPEIIEKIIKGITFPKQMRWSDKSVLFPRPISYFLVLFNDRPVNFELEGISSSNKTRGHYIQHDEMIEINRISEYEDILEKNGVIIDHNKRKEFIRKELHSAAEKAGGVLNEDEELLNTVTFLVENPVIVTCEFDSNFLMIPDIVLIAEMREHQKYFSVLDKNGKLTNYFLVTSNNPETEYVKVGNVRVITARFSDAEFFYNEDKKITLFDRLEQLKNVIFHKDLGSIYDKVKRVEIIADKVCSQLDIDQKTYKKIKRSVNLSKSDLITSMVIEFPSLQGKIGKIYAESEGEDSDVCNAIEDHYKPRFQNDSYPESIISIIISISEKLDNIFGSFSVGNIPKGSQDPFALRRQALAIVDLLIKNNINLSLEKILNDISLNYRDGSSLIKKILDFISARARTIFKDKGFRYDEIDSCLSTGFSDFTELFRRADSINKFRKNEKFSEMLLSFKRMNNIVYGFRKKNSNYEFKFDRKLLDAKEEKELFDFFDSKKDVINSLINSSKYIDLFELLIDAKTIIDSFFDKVLVMDKKIEVRDNRLHLLESILSNFTDLIDFSKISDS